MTDTKKQKRLDTLKRYVSDWTEYYQENMKRYIAHRNFVFKSNLTGADKDALRAQLKPILEFNIMQPYLSRQCGEFSRQEPAVSVKSISGNTPPEIIDFLQGHIEWVFLESNKDNVTYDVFEEMCCGFSALRVGTRYRSTMSFEQEIYFDKVYDPTLVGFDKLARESHKGDGRYCYEIRPYSEDEFESKFGKKYIPKGSVSKTTIAQTVNWEYSTQAGIKYFLVCELFEKKTKKIKIRMLSDGSVMTDSEYKEMIEVWDKLSVPPEPIDHVKEAEVVTIYRTVFTDSDIIVDEEETSYRYLPIIFASGNKHLLRENYQGPVREVTNAYLKNMEGLQRLVNIAGITIANDMENMMQSKLIIAQESIPKGYEDAYTRPQIPSNIVFKSQSDDASKDPLPPPSVVPRVPLPQEVTQTFFQSGSIAQMIMGSYDAALGISGNQISGSAISAGASMSNTAQMPVIVNYLKAITRIGEHFVDLIPKYYVFRDMSLPVKGKDGKVSFQKVNPSQDIMGGKVYLADAYNSEDIQVVIEAGVNFENQRERSFSMLINLMKTLPVMNEYIGSEEQGLEMLLSNLDIRGIDNLRHNIKQFLEMKKQQAQQAQAMSPSALKMKELQLKEMLAQMEMQIKAAKIEVDKQDSDTDRIEALAKIGKMTDDATLERDRLSQEEARTSVASLNAHVNAIDVAHRHAKEILDLHHNNEYKKTKKDLS